MKDSMQFAHDSFIELIKATIDLSDNVANQIASNFDFVEVQRNVLTVKVGTIDSDFTFLCSGYMRSFVHDSTGDEVITQLFKPNRMIFEAGSYFKQTPAKENFETITDCILLKGKFHKCQHMFHTLPEFREFGRRILVNQLIEHKERALSLITEKGEIRYDKFISENADILHHVPLKHIASFLGVTDSSLSRLRNSYIKKQLLVK
jgi:CRP-like cAMP-binding protein